MLGEQFAFVRLLGLALGNKGESLDSLAGLLFIVIGGVFWYIGSKNNIKPVPTYHTLTNTLNTPIFIIGESTSLFSKKHLNPNEFGREITRLGFRMGVDEYGRYLNNPLNTPGDQHLIDVVNLNPGFIQLLYANLITGAFLCYAKALLHAPDNVVNDIKKGIVSELQATMPEMNTEILLNHTKITEDFALVIERELKEIEDNSSVIYFLKGITSFYQSITFSEDSTFPRILFSSLDGYGSRVMAVCQNDFVISFKLG